MSYNTTAQLLSDEKYLRRKLSPVLAFYPMDTKYITNVQSIEMSLNKSLLFKSANQVNIFFSQVSPMLSTSLLFRATRALKVKSNCLSYYARRHVLKADEITALIVDAI